MTRIWGPLVLAPFTFLINYIDGLEPKIIYFRSSPMLSQ